MQSLKKFRSQKYVWQGDAYKNRCCEELYRNRQYFVTFLWELHNGVGVLLESIWTFEDFSATLSETSESAFDPRALYLPEDIQELGRAGSLVTPVCP